MSNALLRPDQAIDSNFRLFNILKFGNLYVFCSLDSVTQNLASMPSLQSCLFALSAATLLSAKEVQRRADTTSSCPWVDVNNVNNGATTAGCCVGGTIAPVFLSVCDGWPICQGPVCRHTPILSHSQKRTLILYSKTHKD